MRDWLQHERVKLYGRLLARVLLFVLCLWLIIRLAPVFLSLFLPFILAFVMASLIYPLVNLLHKKIGMPRRTLSFLLVVLMFISVGTLIGWFVYSLVRETISLARNIEAYMDYLTMSFEILTNNIKWLLDFVPGDTEVIITEIINSFLLWLQDVSKSMADYAISNTVPLTTSLGSGVVATIIFIMAAYFITADYFNLSSRLRALLGSRVYGGYDIVRNAAVSALGRYIRAQLLLALIAFFYMLTGLLLMRQDYALLLALILAVVDFLPFIGTAVILVPWAIICIVTNSIYKGVFLLALSATFFIVRRLLEPKIVSQQTGLSPLATLFSIYAGMKIAGVWGMIGGPIIAMIIISVYKTGIFNGFIKDAEGETIPLRNVFGMGERLYLRI